MRKKPPVEIAYQSRRANDTERCWQCNESIWPREEAFYRVAAPSMIYDRHCWWHDIVPELEKMGCTLRLQR